MDLFTRLLLPAVEPVDPSVLRTGDLVLFSSDRRWTRMFLRFTHVGMVVMRRHGPPAILEIHQKGDVSPTRDTGKVVMYDFWDRVLQYPGRVYVAPLRVMASRPLLFPLNRYKYYDQYASHYMKKCVLGIRPCEKPSDDFVYCSEFICILLRDGMGLPFPKDLDPECLTPAGLLDLGFHDRPRVVLKTWKTRSNGPNKPGCSGT